MEIQESKEGDQYIIALQGHLDTAAAMPLEQQVLKLIEGGAHRLIIDCAGVEYINSSGLKIFLLAAKRIDALGGRFVVCGLAPNVKMIFDMIGFSKILTITPTREEARAAINSPAAARPAPASSSA